jgi:hypothetical protein
MYDIESPIKISSMLFKITFVGGFWKTDIINLNKTLKLKRSENIKK